MAPTMSSRIAAREIGFLTALTLLLVASAQTVNYEAHRHDTIPAKRHVILTTRNFLEELNFVEPKASYTLQEATEHLLQFNALLRMRIVDTFGNLLYVHYDYFSITEVEALHKVYGEMLERRYDLFTILPNILKNQDTRPSAICTEIYNHATESCLRSSVGMCRRIRNNQYDLSHLNRHVAALNVTYQIYRSSKIPKQYPNGFTLAAILKYLQQEVLTITPNLLSGLLYNAKYEKYDDDIRLAERELIRHFRGITSEIPTATKELRKFHTINSFLKYYINMYATKFPKHNLKKYAILIEKRITDDIGTIDENIQLLGNVYENHEIHVGYLFNLVLPDDLIENDVIEAKRYLVEILNKFNVVEKYLEVQKYQQATPAQLLMEITGQLRDINFAKDIATSLRMHAKFWHSGHMIESLNELLELFDTYENLRQIPHYLPMIRKIDTIRNSLRNMKDISIEILCSAPRSCLRMGLRLILQCKFLSPQIKDDIKDFLALSDADAGCDDDPLYVRQDSREIPFIIEKEHYNTTLQTMSTINIGDVTTPRGTEGRRNITENTESPESKPKSRESSSESSRESSGESSRESHSYDITEESSTKNSWETSLEFTSTTRTPSWVIDQERTTAPTSGTITTTSRKQHLSTTSMIITSPTTISPTNTEWPMTTSPTATSATSSMVTTDLPIRNVGMEVERSTITVHRPYGRKPFRIPKAPQRNLTDFLTPPAPIRSSETNECSTEDETSETTNLFSTRRPETLPTRASNREIIQTTRRTINNLVSEPTLPSAELSERPITSECLNPCLDSCRSSGESEITDESCETNCGSVMEDCITKCERDRNSKEDKTDCMELCSSRERVSCERSQDCMTSEVPEVPLNLNHGRKEAYGILCEIRDPHHRRQLKRLARMRSMSAAPVVIATSYGDVLRPTTSRHRDQVRTKKLYNLLSTRVPDSKNKKAADLVKKSIGGKLSWTGKDQRLRKERNQTYGQAKKWTASKRFSRKSTRKTIHREMTPFHHSQTKRIFEKSVKSISA